MARRSILVTGANGYIGRNIVHRLWEAGYPVYGLVSQKAVDGQYIPVEAPDGLPGAPPPDLLAIVMVSGPSPSTDMDDSHPHADAVRRLVAWARHWEVPRLVYVSVLGATTDRTHPLRRVKARAEQHVTDSKVGWTILRPSLVFGEESPLFRRLEAWATRPFVPVPRSMRVVQPLYVGDLAEAVVRVLSLPKTAGRAYEVAGPNPLTVREMLEHMGSDSVWWRRHLFHVHPRWEGRVVHWPWTEAEWRYLEAEPLVRDCRWMTDLGILPRTLTMFYAPYSNR